MAYDQGLAQRIREALEEERGVTEKEMFGGIAFLLNGNMFVGIVHEDLMVRVGPEQHDAALGKPHARPMDFAGRPMKGYVYVAPEGVVADAALAAWVRLGLGFVSTLPGKGVKPMRASRRSAPSKAKAAPSKAKAAPSKAKAAPPKAKAARGRTRKG
jgi:TfoX/Sxy family transcriptional regulator of competence genes